MTTPPGFELATILITVKTYPSPSDRYGETVCVAGVRVDTERPQWVRLYPMLHRLAEYERQFAKYELVEVPIRPHGATDSRPESMRPVQAKLLHLNSIGTTHNWRDRRDLIRPLIGATTTCELIAANRAAKMRPAPSLGLVHANNVTVTVTEGEPWDPRQLAKAKHAAEPDLFGNELKQLEPAPYTIRLHYFCDNPRCPKHSPKLLDWEAGEAGREWRRRYRPSEVKGRLKEKWESMFTPDKDSHIFVGNQHQKRNGFLALGTWYPKIEDSQPLDLGWTPVRPVKRT